MSRSAPSFTITTWAIATAREPRTGRSTAATPMAVVSCRAWLKGLDRRFGDESVTGGMSGRPRHLADQGVSLPAQRHHDPGVVAIHLFGDIDDDRPVALGEIRIGELHDRDHSPIDGETEDRLGQALDITNDLLGRLVEPRQDMDLGDHAALGHHPGRFDPGKAADLLFEVTEVHGSKRSCRGRW